MTNVPDDIRSALADAYKVFDISFTMKGTEQDWIEYWNKANNLVKRYGDRIPLLQLMEGYAQIIQDCSVGNQSLKWDKDEEYPYPKGGKT